MKDADGFKYFLSDHLGSVSLVLDDQGGILEQQRYLPFGEPRTMAPYADVTSTDFTYTGQRALPDTGLMDYRARFYSPSLKRFIQPDSIIPGAANPQSWNRYSYVQNNPVRYNDPTGHMLDDGRNEGGGKYTPSVFKPHKPNKPYKDNYAKEESGLEDKIKKEIDRRFDDPLAGRFPSGYNYQGSPYIALDEQANKVYDSEYYQSKGYHPISYYAESGLNNPMTKDDWENTMGKAWYGDMATTITDGATYILEEINRNSPSLDTRWASNREPNYLYMLVQTHPNEVKTAKNRFYDVGVASWGIEDFWDIMNMSIDDVVSP